MKRGGPLTTVVRWGTGFPDKMCVKLRYVQNFEHNGAGTYTQIFRSNSLFDPDFTGVGGQPRYFDQYALVYLNYRVFGCSMRLSVINSHATVQFSLATLYADSDPTADSFNDFCEYRLGKYHGMLAVNSGGPCTKIVKRYCSTNRLHGIKSTELNENQSSAVTTHPADVGFVGYKIQSVDAGVSATSAVVRAELIYYAEFFGLALVSDS